MATPIRIAEFLPYVMPSAPGAPSIVAEQHIRLAAIEFCERTKCWRKIVTKDLEDANTGVIVAPYYAAIHQIEYASFSADGYPKRPLEPTQYSDISDTQRSDLEQSGPPRYLTQLSPNTVTIYPVMPGTLELSLFLKPRVGTDFVAGTPDDPIQDGLNLLPDFMLTQWGEKIACGALARLLLQPQTRWYDPQRAAYYAQKFDDACNAHFAQGIQGQQRAPLRTKPRYL